MRERRIRPPRQLVIAVQEIWSTRSCRDWVDDRKHDAPNRRENPCLKHPHLPPARTSPENSFSPLGESEHLVEVLVIRRCLIPSRLEWCARKIHSGISGSGFGWERALLSQR